MTRYCPSCGTEVDDAALFCPSCGNPIEAGSARAKPEPAAAPVAPRPEPDEAPAVAAAPATPVGEPEARTEPHPRATSPSAPEAAHPPRPAPVGAARSDRQIDVPVTWPVTLSGWLIGVGVVLAALGVVIGFFDGSFNPIDVLLLPALVLVAATVFFATNVPAIPHLPVATLVVALLAFGIGLDRIGFGGAGLPELLLFLGAAAAAIGAVVLEVGHDQPLGGGS